MGSSTRKGRGVRTKKERINVLLSGSSCGDGSNERDE